MSYDMKCRNYCFTLNAEYVDRERPELGFNTADLKHLCFINWLVLGCVKFVFAQFQNAPTTGCPHYQGYIEFDKPMRVGAIKKLLGCNTMHLEKRLGSQQQQQQQQNAQPPASKSPMAPKDNQGNISSTPQAEDIPLNQDGTMDSFFLQMMHKRAGHAGQPFTEWMQKTGVSQKAFASKKCIAFSALVPDRTDKGFQWWQHEFDLACAKKIQPFEQWFNSEGKKLLEEPTKKPKLQPKPAIKDTPNEDVDSMVTKASSQLSQLDLLS